MPPKTFLPNKFDKYCIIRPYDWHQNKIGYYHVSAVGCDHKHIPKDEHSGPCIRNTFYTYTNPAEQSKSKIGNLWVGGELWHPKLEGIAKINDPFYFPEFPIQRLLESSKAKIIILGSIDLPKQERLTLNHNAKDPLYIDVLDIKTASDYTFPADQDAKNPTHFDQVYIYCAWLQNYYFNPKYIRIRNMTVVYANKHEGYTGELSQQYNNDVGMEKYLNFIRRCFKLDKHLKMFLNVMRLMGKRRIPDLDVRMMLNNCLPPEEKQHWCHYCENRFRCADNVFFEEDIREWSMEELEALYKKETGKNAIWRGKYTKGFESFIHGFKIKGDEL